MRFIQVLGPLSFTELVPCFLFLAHTALAWLSTTRLAQLNSITANQLGLIEHLAWLLSTTLGTDERTCAALNAHAFAVRDVLSVAWLKLSLWFSFVALGTSEVLAL